jgi:photosystem II stability/assembly factor-like uncharacterized protein
MRRILVAACIAIALTCLGSVAPPPAQAYTPDGNHGWYWQMPQPAGLLFDVTYGSASDVWAVGTGGTILHSTDAGLTWAAQQSGTLDDLASVSFADAQHGWACGPLPWLAQGPSVVLMTSNGGTSWIDRTPAGLTKSLTDVSFVDDQHGWAGTTDGFVLRTSDGGASWKTTRVGSARAWLTVDFVDATHGWAVVAGTLWHTSNGGASWTVRHRFANGGVNVDFTGTRYGWAALPSNGGRGSASILATSDGGMRWRTVCRVAEEVIWGLHASGRSRVAFARTVAGENVPDNSFGVTTMSSTTNGGASWKTRRVGLSGQPLAIGGRDNALCSVGEGILTSADAGASWHATSSGQLYFLNDGVAVSASDLWAVDEGGALLHSGDGAQWTEQPSPMRYSQELRAVSFPNADNGWVVGNTLAFPPSGIILHTSDGGTSWSPQASSLAGELVGVDFVDDTNGWAISDDPEGFGTGGAMTVVEHTADGGSSWVPQYVTNDPSLAAVDFASATTGWVAGTTTIDNSEAAEIDKTTNGGQTWTKESLPKGTTGLSDLQFVDQNEGWAVGTSFDESGPASAPPNPQGWLLHTTNGGTSWARVGSLPAGISASSVRFLDAQHGWVGGEGVWATGDGGATWSKVAGTGMVNAIAASDTDHVWAFGDGVVATVNGGSGDTAPPQTLDNADWGWHRHAVTITLTANDTGGSGLAGTRFSSDGGTTWQSGASIAAPAPPGQANDGVHSFLYRSSDNAGNVEATEICGVGIDTLGPVCAAPKKAIADSGKSVIIRFKANDGTSGVARATIKIESRSGRVLHTLITHAGNWLFDPPGPPFLWLRYTCKLKPGLYRIVVQATDRAGNRQVITGRNWLRVVRKGAPPARHPDWPAGLPETPQSGFSTLAAAALRSPGPSASGWLLHRLRAAGASHLLGR